MKNILITGGAGFIGSHVVIYLLNNYNYKIVVFDKLDYCGTLSNLKSVKNNKNFKFIKGDIQSAELVNYVLKEEKINTIMHFASHTHVDNSFGNSINFTMNNMLGTHTLLEACRQHGKITRFINVSTDEVYGESSFGLDKGLNEDSLLVPTNPYSAAKAGAEMMCHAYYKSYKMPIIITRGNNVYGPHQFPEKMIPKFIIKVLKKDKLPVHGKGLSMRSYLYVKDVAKAFSKILHDGVIGEIYNVGIDEERTVNDVARDICKEMGYSVDNIDYVEDRAFNDRRYFIGYDKLKSLGWEVETEWKDGLKETIEWYKSVNPLEYWPHSDINTALKAHSFNKEK